MQRRAWFGGTLLALVGIAGAAGSAAGENWPQYRGENAQGISQVPGPTAWDVESGEGVRWKTPIRGLGHSSPILWGDRIYVTSAISGKKKPKLRVGLYGDIGAVKDDTPHRFTVVALDRRTGKILWEKVAHEGVPKIKRHTKASHANSTPATDGQTVIAFFGSEGLYAYDTDGELIWKRDLGVLDSGFFRVPEAQWGFGSSPVIHDGKVLIQVDVQKGSYVAALDLKTGETLWKTEREEVPTWGSPSVVEVDGRKQMLVNGWHHIGSYDLASGKEVWRMRGGGDIPVPTPIVGDGLTYITNAHGSMAPVYAVRQGAKGDISLEEGETTNAGIAWSVGRGGAYMQTPILIGNRLYVCRDNGVLSVFDAADGRRLYQERLGSGKSGFTASAVAAGDRIYYTGEMGDVLIVKAGDTFRKVGEAALDEIVMSTPAVADGVLYIRAKDHLYALGAKSAATGGP